MRSPKSTEENWIKSLKRPRSRLQRFASEVSDVFGLYGRNPISLTDITSSGAPFTIWKSFNMKPEGTEPPPSLLGTGEPSRLLSTFIVARTMVALLFFRI